MNEDKLSALILKYVQHFAARNSSCFDDVRKYLNRIEDEGNQQKLLQLVREEMTLQNQEDQSGSNLTQKRLCSVLQREICYHQMELFFGLWMDDEEGMLRKRVQSLYKEWHLNVDKIVKQEDTDETAADGLILVAVHILLHLAASQRERTREYLMDAILLCEMGIEKSAYNFRIRLTAMRLYCHPMIGNVYGALHHFNKLKITGVQMDSLSHLLYHDAARYGFTTKATTGVIPFLHSQMETHRREFAQANLARTELCFEHSNYHKAIEFAEFSYTMTKSEMYLISQADHLVSKLVNYHGQQKQFPKMSDYVEAFIVPHHPYLKTTYFDQFQEDTKKGVDALHESKEKENDEKGTEYEWEEKTWIDLNDYTTIPVYVRERKQNELHEFIIRPPVSSISHCVTAADGADEKESGNGPLESPKVSHVQLLLSSLGMLYTSLTFESSRHSEFMAAELKKLWNLMRSLKFVHSEQSKDISNALEQCNDANYHWILVHCFHSLNVALFADNADGDALAKDFASICSKYSEHTERLRLIFVAEITKENDYRVTGVHLERMWRFISILSFTAMPLFEHWSNGEKLKEDMREMVNEKWQQISKGMDQFRRTLSEILKGIESDSSVIAITRENRSKNADSKTVRLDPNDLEKVLKQHRVEKLWKHESCLILKEQEIKKSKLQTVKIAMINVNNAARRNSVDVLTQNIAILKQLRFSV